MDWGKETQRIEDLPYKLPAKLTALLEVYKKAIHERNTSVVIVVDGRSGMGKTTLANQICKYMDSDYDLHKIHYKPIAFLEGDEKHKKVGLSECKMGAAILFDESMILSSRSALTEVNKMVVSAMSMIRSRKLFIVFCINSIFDLDKNLALSRADLLLHVYGNSLVDRGKFLAFFTGADGFNRIKRLYLLGKKYYSYSLPRSNFISRFGKNFVVDEGIYDKQKDENVKEFLEGTGKRGDTRKSLLTRDLYILNMLENGKMTQQQVADIGKLHIKTVTNIVRRHRGIEAL